MALFREGLFFFWGGGGANIGIFSMFLRWSECSAFFLMKVFIGPNIPPSNHSYISPGKHRKECLPGCLFQKVAFFVSVIDNKIVDVMPSDQC